MPLDSVAMLEGAATGLVVRFVLALAGGLVADDGGPLPSDSGRRGNLLAAAVWLTPMVVLLIVSRVLVRAG